MGVIRGVIGGIIGGAVGAAIWAAVTYFTHYEVGMVAWGVGLLVGLGTAIGAGNSCDSATGALAGLVALASIGVGKYAAVSLEVNSQAATIIHASLHDEDVQMFMAHQLVREYEGQNKKLAWPNNMDADSAEKPADFPPDLWKDVQTRWTAMDETQKADYRKGVEEQIAAAASSVGGSFTRSGFMASFGPMDLLWAFFALGSAYRLGSGSTGKS